MSKVTEHEGRHESHGDALTVPPGRKLFTVFAALLVVALGVAIAAQVHGTDSGDALNSARPADLLAVLDNLNRREASLREESANLQATIGELQRSGSGAALGEARKRLDAVSIQVGSVAATGPGVVLRLEDPQARVRPEVMLDVIAELRAAGAEAMQIGGTDGATVRIGVDSWVGGAPGGIVVDDKRLQAPYTVTAIGDAPTLAAAVNIPGGVVDTVSRNGGKLSIEQSQQVTVAALREPKPHQYSQPGK